MMSRYLTPRSLQQTTAFRRVPSTAVVLHQSVSSLLLPSDSSWSRVRTDMRCFTTPPRNAAKVSSVKIDHRQQQQQSSSSGVTRAWEDVPAVDIHSRGRVSNFLARIGNKHASSLDTTPLHFGRDDGGSEKEKEDYKTAFLFQSVLTIELPAPHGIKRGIGVAATAKDAEGVAMMHAERIIDSCGLHLHRLARSQERYAKEVRQKGGRWAPLPTDPEGRTDPRYSDGSTPPPLRFVSSALRDLMSREEGVSATTTVTTLAAEQLEVTNPPSFASKPKKLRPQQLGGGRLLKQQPPALSPTDKALAVSSSSLTQQQRSQPAPVIQKKVGGGTQDLLAMLKQRASSSGRPGGSSFGGGGQEWKPLSNSERIRMAGGGLAANPTTPLVAIDESENGKYDMVDAYDFVQSSHDDTIQFSYAFEANSLRRLKNWCKHNGERYKNWLSSSQEDGQRRQQEEEGGGLISPAENIIVGPPTAALADAVKVFSQSENEYSSSEGSMFLVELSLVPFLERGTGDLPQESPLLVRRNEGGKKVGPLLFGSNLDSPFLISQGKARDRHIATVLAAMHAELLLDYYGLPLFNAPGGREEERQREHMFYCEKFGRGVGYNIYAGSVKASADLLNESEVGSEDEEQVVTALAEELRENKAKVMERGTKNDSSALQMDVKVASQDEKLRQAPRPLKARATLDQAKTYEVGFAARRRMSQDEIFVLSSVNSADRFVRGFISANPSEEVLEEAQVLFQKLEYKVGETTATARIHAGNDDLKVGVNRQAADTEDKTRVMEKRFVHHLRNDYYRASTVLPVDISGEDRPSYYVGSQLIENPVILWVAGVGVARTKETSQALAALHALTSAAVNRIKSNLARSNQSSGSTSDFGRESDNNIIPASKCTISPRSFYLPLSSSGEDVGAKSSLRSATLHPNAPTYPGFHLDGPPNRPLPPPHDVLQVCALHPVDDFILPRWKKKKSAGGKGTLVAEVEEEDRSYSSKQEVDRFALDARTVVQGYVKRQRGYPSQLKEKDTRSTSVGEAGVYPEYYHSVKWSHSRGSWHSFMYYISFLPVRLPPAPLSPHLGQVDSGKGRPKRLLACGLGKTKKEADKVLWLHARALLEEYGVDVAKDIGGDLDGGENCEASSHVKSKENTSSTSTYTTPLDPWLESEHNLSALQQSTATRCRPFVHPTMKEFMDGIVEKDRAGRARFQTFQEQTRNHQQR